MEGADGTYEEFPEQSRDDYEPMNSSQIFIDMSQVQTEAKEPLFSPLVSPMRGTPKEGYHFYDPLVRTQEELDQDNSIIIIETNEDFTPRYSQLDDDGAGPDSLGYDLGEFNEDGYLGPESLSGYLNFDMKRGDEGDENPTVESSSFVQEEEDDNYVEHQVGATAKIVAMDTSADDNYVSHMVGSGSNNDNNSVEGNNNAMSSSGIENDETQVIVANSQVFKRSRLEMEDLFAEILRKTGAVYGRQKIMEFLQRTAVYFGEKQLIQAIQKTVQVTSPTLLEDSGHLSRTVWNEKFQAALEITDSTERNERLAALRADFISTAEFYGRIILAERFLPVYRKSIKPISLGGVAGGTKYLVQGVLYKFAEDVDLGGGRWMYGGDERNDAAAAKACGNELKGLSAVFQASPELDLRVPLMCLVDFSGFRLSAQAFLPVGSGTLVYGSRDAGKTILSGKRHPKVQAMMSRLAERLRLEPHIVVDARMEKHLLYGPTDIEVHLGYDGRYYLLDSARLMPPQTPPRTAVRAIFYQLFRSEFLTFYNTPLSPDGYTRFGQHDWRKHNAKLKIATEVLIDNRIPDFVKTLTSKDAQMLTSLMHSWGINIRFLGHVRHKSNDKSVQAAALLEMIARTLQKMLLERLREEMGRIRAPQMSPYLHLVSDFFNMLISDVWFWKRPKALKSRIIGKFGIIALKEEEREGRISLAKLIHMPTLLARLCHLGGIHLRSGPRLESEDLNEPFVTSDFTIVPRITEMDIASLALAEQYRKQAKRKLASNKLVLLQSAAEIFSKAAISNPHHLSNRVRWLRVLIAIIRHSIGSGMRFGNAELESEFVRADAVLRECIDECKNLAHMPPEVVFLESSLLRQKYLQYMSASGSSNILEGLEYWTKSYKLLLKSSECPDSACLHVGLSMLKPGRFQHRKMKRWLELVLGLDHMTDLRKLPEACVLLGPIVAQDLELARYLVTMLNARKTGRRNFGALFSLFRPYPPLMDLLKRWLNSESSVIVHELTMEYLEDSVVANIIQLCTEAILTLDLSNCSGITNDAMLMLARTPALQKLSLRRCHHVTDEGILSVIRSFPDLKILNLSECVRVSDKAFAHEKLPKLEELVLSHCVSIQGGFLQSKTFAPKLRVLIMDQCHRLLKANIMLLSSLNFPKLECLDLSHLSVAGGQVVNSILKKCRCLTQLRLRNTPVSEKGFRIKASRYDINLTRLSLQNTEIDEDALSHIAMFPRLSRLNIKRCGSISSKGVIDFVSLRPKNAAPLTHLNITDVPHISEGAMHSLLCELPGSPEAWSSLKLSGCSVSLETLLTVFKGSVNLRALSLSGRAELDVPKDSVAIKALKKLYLEACSWSPQTLKQFLGKAMENVKLRSCPNLGNVALKAISIRCPEVEKLHLAALPITGKNCLKPISELKRLRKLWLEDLAVDDAGVVPLLNTVMSNLARLSIRELNVTDKTWECITTWGMNLKSFKMSRCPIRNNPNRLTLLPKLQYLHLAAFSTPPFDHSESAAELNQLRVLTLDAAICANAAAFEHLGYSRSLQKLIVLPVVPPAWWRTITEKPIRNSLLSLFLANSPQASLPFLRGLSSLTEINLRESTAKAVFPDIGAMFPLLVFPSRSLLHKSRNTSAHFQATKSRQRSIVRTILNTSSSLGESEDDSSDISSPDITMGWALLSEAQLELQLHIGRLLLETGYKLILIYRGNRNGTQELLDFATRYQDRVVAVKLQDLFDAGLQGLEKRFDSIELVITGLAGPVNKEQEGCSIDFLRRSMQEIPYSVVNLLQLVKPLVLKGKQKLVVVTSSVLGSISDNFTGRTIALRAATSALNQIVKCFSLEAEAWGGCYVLLSPQTSEDFPSSSSEAVAVTAAKFVKTCTSLSFKDNGCWYNTQKQIINW